MAHDHNIWLLSVETNKLSTVVETGDWSGVGGEGGREGRGYFGGHLEDNHNTDFVYVIECYICLAEC